MSKKETTVEDLQTASEAPEVIHLNIGMRGELHTYVLVKPKRKKRGRPPTLKPQPLNHSVQKRTIVDRILDKVFSRPATLHSAL